MHRHLFVAEAGGGWGGGWDVWGWGLGMRMGRAGEVTRHVERGGGTGSSE